MFFNGFEILCGSFRSLSVGLWFSNDFRGFDTRLEWFLNVFDGF